MNRTTWLGIAGAALVVGAACHDSVNIFACFEPNVSGYRYSLPTDSNFVFRWPASYNPVRVYAEPTGELQANTLAAMQLWGNAFHCGELSMQMVSDSTRADIIVRNPTAIPPAAAGTIVLAADSVGACRGLTTDSTATGQPTLAGPIRSFVAPISADPVAVAACYHFVTAHEQGHALGLLSHSLDPVDLMYTLPRRRVLSQADKVTIESLYHTTPTIGPPPRQ